jgi:DNA N-6-adenine-methyltransferase (Dam)
LDDSTRLQHSGSNHIVSVSILRQELENIRTPQDAQYQADRAARIRDLYKLLGRSVAECNELAEIYLLAEWKFGDLIKDIPEGRPSKLHIDVEFSGTRRQREYAKRFNGAAKESDVPEYVQYCTAEQEQASVSGCLEWLDPGRHGNLKGEYEWYTPPEIIEAARAVMGGIDLDPASCEQANEIVQATQYFSEKDNGLGRPWHGRVFVNPPFAHPAVKYFAEQLLESLETGDIEQAVWLSNACVDVGWWQRLAAKGISCFHRGRIRFYGPFDKGQSPTLGQTIIYLGPHRELFRATFETFGVVLS